MQIDLGKLHDLETNILIKYSLKGYSIIHKAFIPENSFLYYKYEGESVQSMISQHFQNQNKLEASDIKIHKIFSNNDIEYKREDFEIEVLKRETKYKPAIHLVEITNKKTGETFKGKVRANQYRKAEDLNDIKAWGFEVHKQDITNKILGNPLFEHNSTKKYFTHLEHHEPPFLFLIQQEVRFPEADYIPYITDPSEDLKEYEGRGETIEYQKKIETLTDAIKILNEVHKIYVEKDRFPETRQREFDQFQYEEIATRVLEGFISPYTLNPVSTDFDGNRIMQVRFRTKDDCMVFSRGNRKLEIYWDGCIHLIEGKKILEKGSLARGTYNSFFNIHESLVFGNILKAFRFTTKDGSSKAHAEFLEGNKEYHRIILETLQKHQDSLVSRSSIPKEQRKAFNETLGVLEDLEENYPKLSNMNISIFEKNFQWTYLFGSTEHPLYDINMLGHFISALTSFFGVEVKKGFNQFVISSPSKDYFVIQIKDQHFFTAFVRKGKYEVSEILSKFTWIEQKLPVIKSKLSDSESEKFQCDLCKEGTSQLIHVESENRDICRICYESEYGRCQKCEKIFHVDHLDDNNFCAGCLIEKLEQEAEIFINPEDPPRIFEGMTSSEMKDFENEIESVIGKTGFAFLFGSMEGFD